MNFSILTQSLTLVNLITDAEEHANPNAYSDYNAGGIASTFYLPKSTLMHLLNLCVLFDRLYVSICIHIALQIGNYITWVLNHSFDGKSVGYHYLVYLTIKGEERYKGVSDQAVLTAEPILQNKVPKTPYSTKQKLQQTTL